MRAEHREPPRRRKQSGVALLTVLLVVAIATVFATSQVSRQNLSIHRTRNLLESTQALQYALGGEEIARQILYEDFIDENPTDHLGEVWALPLEPYEFEQGEVEIQILDLQSVFNLNNLRGPGTGTPGMGDSATGDPTSGTPRVGGRGNPQAASVTNYRRFLALLGQLGLDPMLADRIADWVDEDQSRRQLGAEDYEYLGLQPPYRSGAGPMADPSELRLVLELEDEHYRALLPYVTALPVSGSGININTAPPVILQTIATDLSPEAAEGLAAQRDEDGGFQSVDEFAQLEGVTGQAGIDVRGLVVRSSFFLVNVRARYNERVSILSSIVQRNQTDGSLVVISRDLGQRFYTRIVNEERPELSED